MPEAENKETKEGKEDGDRKVISVSLPTDAYFKSGVRDFAYNIITNMTEFSEQWAYRFQSVVDELCNNAIEHGCKPGDYIKIEFIIKPGVIEFAVEDTGNGETQMQAKQLYERINELKAATMTPLVNIGLRGRGLAQIVANWTDELNFEDLDSGGIRAHVVKYLKNAQAEAEQSKEASGAAGIVFG